MSYVHKYFDFIPESLRSRTVIAGGAAVDFHRASDVDLFVLDFDPERDEQMIYDHLEAVHVEHQILDPANPLYPDRVLVDGQPQFMKPFQIIGSSMSTLEHLLNSFDISTHQVGLTFAGQRVSIGTTTSTSQVPVILRWNKDSLDLTLGRYKKIVERYGISPRRVI